MGLIDGVYKVMVDFIESMNQGFCLWVLIELGSCLLAPGGSQNSEFVVSTVIPQIISHMVMFDPATLRRRGSKVGHPDEFFVKPIRDIANEA